MQLIIEVDVICDLNENEKKTKSNQFSVFSFTSNVIKSENSASLVVICD